jgi:hypothetical protein
MLTAMPEISLRKFVVVFGWQHGIVQVAKFFGDWQAADAILPQPEMHQILHLCLVDHPAFGIHDVGPQPGAERVLMHEETCPGPVPPVCNALRTYAITKGTLLARDPESPRTVCRAPACLVQHGERTLFACSVRVILVCRGLG